MRYHLEFSKFQGCGNDFIIVDEMEGRRTPDSARSRLAKSLTDRRFKIGADGLIFIEKAKGHDGSMRHFEPAGNEADMCGNGIRCVASYLSHKLGKRELDILTRDGTKHIVKVGKEFRVDMGIVRTARRDMRAYLRDRGGDNDSMLRFPLELSIGTFDASVVNSGEPHIVARVRRVDDLDVVALGEEVNSDHRRFPKGVNLNLVEVVGPHALKVRTYERGVYDETLACGTGATASAFVALKRKWVRPGTVLVHPRGGTIEINVDADGRALMTGPAACVFEGHLTVEL